MRVGQSDRGLRQLVVETVSSTTRLEPLSTHGKNIGIEKWDSSRHELGTMFDDIHSQVWNLSDCSQVDVLTL